MGCALASRGRRTCIMEAKPTVSRSKRGLTLQPNGMAALKEMGLLDQVATIGSKTTRVIWREIGGKPLMTLDYSILNHPHNYLLTLVPSELEAVLRELVSKRNGIILESTFFQQILPSRSERVLVEAEKYGSISRFSARIIVGADGENSKVRQALQIPFRVREYPNHFLFMLQGQSSRFREKQDSILFGVRWSVSFLHKTRHIFSITFRTGLSES